MREYCGLRADGQVGFAAVQSRYPTSTGQWSFDVYRLVGDGATIVSEVTVTDGEQSARLVAFSDVAGDDIVRQVEYWPVAYDPPPGREDLTLRQPGSPEPPVSARARDRWPAARTRRPQFRS